MADGKQRPRPGIGPVHTGKTPPPKVPPPGREEKGKTPIPKVPPSTPPKE